MGCLVRADLLVEYQMRVRAYGFAVRTMRRTANISPQDYRLLWDQANERLSECLRAQRQLCEHIAVHGCASDDDTFSTRSRWAA
jgi:ribosomal protein L19E